MKANIPSICNSAIKASESINWSTVYDRISETVLKFNQKNGSPISVMDAEDVIQNSCEKIFRNIGKYDSSKAKLSTWIGKIVVNCYYDALRERFSKIKSFKPFLGKKEQEDDDVVDSLYDSPDYCTESEAFAADFDGLLSLVLNPLCETYRKAILGIVDKKTSEEMRMQINCSEKNLYPTLSRARNAARKSCMALGII